MKHALLVTLVSAALVVSAAVYIEAQMPVDPTLRNFNTIEVDNFDTEGYWEAKFSRYRSINLESTWGNIPRYDPILPDADRTRETFPRTDNADFVRWIQNSEGRTVVPTGVSDMHGDQADGSVIGVRGNWDFPGYNWLMLEPSFTRSAGVYPGDEGERACSQPGNMESVYECGGFSPDGYDDATPPRPYYLDRDHFNSADTRPKLLPHYVHIPGQVEEVDYWVWGKGYNYDLELHFEDYLGNAHVLNGPRLDFFGWRNFRMEIPSFVPQTQRYLPQAQGVKFLRFKVTSTPSERPDDFNIYFDYMQALTDLYRQPFFGDDLVRHPEWVEGEGGTTPPTN